MNCPMLSTKKYSVHPPALSFILNEGWVIDDPLSHCAKLVLQTNITTRGMTYIFWSRMESTFM